MRYWILHLLAASVMAVWSGITGTCVGAEETALPELQAQWIWAPRTSYTQYNDTIVARKSVNLPEPKRATLRITADSYYRLYINDQWVADGPCRSWPAHYQYDELEVGNYLRDGQNEIRIVAKFFGVGTFHQVPIQAGLLAQLDVELDTGKLWTVITNHSWLVADATNWLPNTPKQCVQMGPFEVYDAGRARGEYRPAAVLFDTHDGPWKNLHPRDCPLLTREPFALRNFVGASVVARPWRSFGFPTAQLLYPGTVVTCNNHNSMASAVATIVRCDQPLTLQLEGDGQAISIDGQRQRENRFELEPGDHFLFSVLQSYFGHWNSDMQIRFLQTEGFELINPLDGSSEDPWCFVPFEEAKFLCSDLDFALKEVEEQQAIEQRIRGVVQGHQERVTSVDALRDVFGEKIRKLSTAHDLATDVHWQFKERQVLAPATTLVENPAGLMYDNAEVTVVQPAADGDVELIYDLGEQNCGYYQFDLMAEQGLILDVFGVEYIAPDGRVQHTQRYRNGMRYVCREGANRFTSLARRSQRYLFLTLRNQTRPVTIRNVRLLESTYPVVERGRFACSDERLNRIWEISARTLKLCMEDTYTDCPLYEQTLWVGDARNEALFAFTAFGAHDLSRRCIVLTGQSFDQYPLTLCQVPSTWEIILPAWGFLWGISVWDYYAYTGDRAFLEQAWPWVVQALEGAARFTDERGLFSGPFWNMFDWSGSDQNHNTVLHNSMFLVGAIDAALKCAQVLDDQPRQQWLQGYRDRTVQAINALWDDQRGAYPDSVHNDGTISPKSSIHTSFLALLYDVAAEEHRDQVLENLLDPPAEMVKVGSPFAILYLYEALEKAGRQDRIVESIYESYLPMLELGATTVWESFSTGTTGGEGFPTRSHCHAWSSAPIHFLNRIVLGILPQGVGGREVIVSPRLNGLNWAEGTTATFAGDVSVAWRLSDRTLTITATGPAGTQLRFEPNATLEGLSVVFNGESQ